MLDAGLSSFTFNFPDDTDKLMPYVLFISSNPEHLCTEGKEKACKKSYELS